MRADAPEPRASTSSAARLLFVYCVMLTLAVWGWAQFLHPPRKSSLSAIFLLLFTEYDGKAAVWSIAVLVLALFLAGRFSAARLLVWVDHHVTSVAIVAAGILCAGALFIYRDHPLSMDEYSQYFQSQVFAAGRLSARFPIALIDWLVPPDFQDYFLSVSKSTGAVISSYWPSYALLLTPFTALGVPWAANPVMSALTLLAAHRLAWQIYADPQAAALVVLLTAASPEFFVNGMSFYAMPAHLLANTLFASMLVEPTRARAFLAGLIGSIALTLHNPFPHLLFATPWIVWTAKRPDGYSLLLRLAAGYLPLCLLLGLGWLWFLGSVRHPSLAVSGGHGNLASMWHSLAVFRFPDETVVLARLLGIAKIWVWSVPGLLLLAAVGAFMNRGNAVLRVFSWSACLTLVGYFFVPVDQGHGWGYRYFHSAWVALPLLAVGALSRGGTSEREAGPFQDETCRAFVVACAVGMLLIGDCVRAVQVRDFMAFDVSQVPAYPGTEPRIVLIDPTRSFYGPDLVQNDPRLRSDVIRMISHGDEEDARMMSRNFPDLHQVYRDRYGSVWSKR